jgi:DNA polymerase-3 subunit gamma/tau
MAAPDESSAGEYVVVARRYRPQDFSQLVGQGQVSQALANAIATNRVGHAYLFTGARGVGKTSTARIFAKALNCVNGPTATPCGQCDICQGIASGSDVDVVEIDGASNRRIEEIRQLRSNVNVRPSRARFKIYIIDEVHMLTREAFNALLKTLEEPPEHVKFIFCTTEADKIPITILSRCQRFDFAPIETRSIIERLQHICQTEGVEAEPEALQIIARRAAGSMRDSQSLLEQLLSFGGQKITVADVHAMLGTAHSARLAALAQCIVRRDAAAALAEVEKSAAEGVDLGQLTEQLLGYFRDGMAALVGCGPDLMLHTSAAEFSDVKTLGEQLGLETLLAMAQILDQTLVRLRQSTHVRTLVEVAVVRLCKLDDLDQLPALVASLQGGAPLAPISRPPSPPPAASGQTVRSAPIQSPEARSAPTPAAEAQKKMPEGADQPAVVSEPASPLDEQAAAAAWKQTLGELGDMTADFASKAENVAISAPNRLVVRFRKAYTSAIQFCERPESRQKLEQTLSRITGRQIRIDIAVLPDANGGVPGTEVAPARRPVNRRQREQEVQRHPLIRKATELFDTEIVTILDAPRTDETEPLAEPAAGETPPATG